MTPSPAPRSHRWRPRFARSGRWCSLLLVFLAGCSSEIVYPAYPANAKYESKPHVVLVGTDQVKTFELSKEETEYMEKLLLPVFGTPREPLVKLDGIQAELATLQLTPASMAAGSKLFLAQCAHCHGKEGNGLGKSALVMNPKPRDFRQGKFKYVTTVRKDPNGKPDTALAAYPARTDLHKTIYHGLDGAGMNGFKQPDDQIEALVSYVMHLSLRGQIEYRLTRLWLEELGKDEKPNEKDLAKELKEIVKLWAADAQSIYQPQVPWEEIAQEGEKEHWAKGRELFLTKAGCIDCHGKDGRANIKDVPNIAAMKDDWGSPIKPRNYHEEALRGGKRPIDIFYRIKLGIKPSRMQAADMTKLSDADIWQLVGYIRSIEGKKSSP
jgi:mono/diheme cytochrome c family protein